MNPVNALIRSCALTDFGATEIRDEGLRGGFMGRTYRMFCTCTVFWFNFGLWVRFGVLKSAVLAWAGMCSMRNVCALMENVTHGNGMLNERVVGGVRWFGEAPRATRCPVFGGAWRAVVRHSVLTRAVLYVTFICLVIEL